MAMEVTDADEQITNWREQRAPRRLAAVSRAASFAGDRPASACTHVVPREETCAAGEARWSGSRRAARDRARPHRQWPPTARPLCLEEICATREVSAKFGVRLGG